MEIQYIWAENNIKLHFALENIKKRGEAITDESVKREYLKMGGRIVLADGEILDTTVADWESYLHDPAADQSETRQDMEAAPVVRTIRAPSKTPKK